MSKNKIHYYLIIKFTLDKPISFSLNYKVEVKEIMSQEGVTETKKPSNNILLVIAVLAVVIGGAAYGISSNSKQPQNQNQNIGSNGPSAAPNEIKGSAVLSPATKVLLYGTWSSNQSDIKGIDTQTGKAYEIAQLPTSVKHVSLLPNDKLLYINNLDSTERGSSLATYSLTDKTITTIAKADEGYGIDKYVVSGNGKYIVDWEVKPSAGSTALNGGDSKVYGIDTANPSQKHLIYSEVIDKVHYIIAVSNEGKAYFDLFQTNVPMGWSNGMSVADYTGANKQDIASMQAGTYGRVAVLSPDGKNLAFAGYDGSQGAGTDLINSAKRAIRVSNTVELLDTSTLQRTKLPGFSNTNKYDTVVFDKNTGNLAISQITPPQTSTDLLLYDINTKTQTKIPNSTNLNYVASLSTTQNILSTPNNSESLWGNLGEVNAPTSSGYTSVDSANGKTTPYTIADAFMQTIDIVPGSSLQNALISELNDQNGGDKGLKMYTFQLKTDLVTQRKSQLGNAYVGNSSFSVTTAPSSSSAIQDISNSLTSSDTSGEENKSGSCKPAIYLYPSKTENVTVKLGLKGDLTYTKPVYPQDGWKVIANPDGSLVYNGEVIDYLYYEMKVADSDLASVRNSDKGYVVAYQDLGTFFGTLLPKLGLNNKEINGYKEYWLKALPKSPYYRISIVPVSLLNEYAKLSISPTPDSVVRVTLDFQPIDKKIELKEPQLPSFKRSGFTVVEWAGTYKADKNHPFTCLM